MYCLRDIIVIALACLTTSTLAYTGRMTWYPHIIFWPTIKVRATKCRMQRPVVRLQLQSSHRNGTLTFSSSTFKNGAQFAGSCGKCVTISYGGKSVKASIVDLCPSKYCSYGQIDASKGVFAQFANLDIGILQVSWQFTTCTGNTSPSIKPKKNAVVVKSAKLESLIAPQAANASQPDTSEASLEMDLLQPPTPSAPQLDITSSATRLYPFDFSLLSSQDSSQETMPLESLLDLQFTVNSSQKQECFNACSTLRHQKSLDDLLDAVEAQNQALAQCGKM